MSKTYKMVEIVGTSPNSFADAVQEAVRVHERCLQVLNAQARWWPAHLL